MSFDVSLKDYIKSCVDGVMGYAHFSGYDLSDTENRNKIFQVISKHIFEYTAKSGNYSFKNLEYRYIEVLESALPLSSLPLKLYFFRNISADEYEHCMSDQVSGYLERI